MRVIVFGGTSRLGRQVWRKALDAGHQVTVFGRAVKELQWDLAELIRELSPGAPTSLNQMRTQLRSLLADGS